MTSDPRISVVIPAFNAERTLAACLRSVLTQTTSPAEIIVVDDGSSDGTAGVAESFGSEIQVVRQENQGSAVARQTGTMLASAEFIAYLDADDWWPDSRLEKFTEIINSERIHFLMTDFVRAPPNASPNEYLPRNTASYPWFLGYLRAHADPCGTANLYRLPQSRALDSILRGFPCYPSAMIARKSSIVGVGGWDKRFRRCQDFDIALRLTRKFPMHFLNEAQAVVGLNEGNKDRTAYVIQQTSGDIRVLQTHYAENRSDLEYASQVASALARKNYGLGNAYRVTSDWRAARKAYFESLKWPGKRAKAVIAFCRYLFCAIASRLRSAQARV